MLPVASVPSPFDGFHLVYTMYNVYFNILYLRYSPDIQSSMPFVIAYLAFRVHGWLVVYFFYRKLVKQQANQASSSGRKVKKLTSSATRVEMINQIERVRSIVNDAEEGGVLTRMDKESLGCMLVGVHDSIGSSCV